MASHRRRSGKRSHSKRKLSRKSKRRSVRRRKSQRGGNYNAGQLNLIQGQQYRNTHATQSGGGSALYGAPIGDSGMLPADLRIAARIGPLDSATAEISGMRDEGTVAAAPTPTTQSGGRRRSRRSTKSRKSRKSRRSASKKSRKTKSRKTKRSRRRQRGGALSGAPYNAPSMLLSPAAAARAGTADFSNPLLKY